MRSIAVLMFMGILLMGCGGGGGGGGGTPVVTTATGQFKDGNVEGVTYESGGQQGVTDANGTFTYEVGETVTLSIGGLTLGTTDGKPIITPLDMFSGSSSNSTDVQNMVRLLLMLDEDGNPDNGIKISAAVQTIASNWSQIDFSSTDLATQVASIITDAQAADGGTHTLPTSFTARLHFESTLRCSYSGAYKGTYSGSDNGTFGVLVDASNGRVEGVAYSIPLAQYIGLVGITPISYDSLVSFISGNTSTGASYSGQFDTTDTLSGTWQLGADSGNFSGSRIGSSNDAQYRFTGNYAGDDYGVYAFDVDSADGVTGIAYSVTDDQTYDLTGTVTGSSLSVTASDGTSVTGTLDRVTGALSGFWIDNAQNLSGTFSGSGCKLN